MPPKWAKQFLTKKKKSIEFAQHGREYIDFVQQADW